MKRYKRDTHAYTNLKRQSTGIRNGHNLEGVMMKVNLLGPSAIRLYVYMYTQKNDFINFHLTLIAS